MMEILNSTIGQLLGGGALGAIVTGVCAYLLNRAKQRGDFCLAEDAQVVRHYSELVTRLEARIAKVEADHERCMTEHRAAQHQLGILEGQVAELTTRVRQGTSDT